MVQTPAFDLPELLDALEIVDVALLVLDRELGVRWTNDAAVRLTGAAVGRSVVSVIPAECKSGVVDALVRAIVRGESSTTTLAAADGHLQGVVVRSAPLRRQGEIAGALAVAVPLPATQGSRPAVERRTVLTPRQFDVLRLLASGLSTEAIAERLGVAVETARNHIRALLRRLDAHSRLEAVVEARRRGLLDE
jgi:DNA-binding NarL/FixJ family response regulator